MKKATTFNWRKTSWGWNANYGDFGIQIYVDDPDSDCEWRVFYKAWMIKEGKQLSMRSAKRCSREYLSEIIASAHGVSPL